MLLYDDHIKSNILVCMYEYIWNDINEPVFVDSVAQTLADLKQTLVMMRLYKNNCRFKL